MTDVFINFNGDIFIQNKIIQTYNDIKYIYRMETKLIIYRYNGELISINIPYNPKEKYYLDPNNCDNTNIELLMNNQDINLISCGYEYSLIYKNNGDLYEWGINTLDGSSIYNSIFIKKPKYLINIPDIKTLHCQTNYIIIEKINGDIYHLGCIHRNLIYKELTFLSNIQNIKYFECQYQSFYILTNDNFLYGYGHNSHYELGIEHGNNISSPILIDKFDNIKNFYCTGLGCIIQKYNGDIIVFGDNSFGQLGFSNIESIKTPKLLLNDINIDYIYCTGYILIVYKCNGDILLSGYIRNKYYSKSLTLLKNIIEIRYIWINDNNLFLYRNNGDILISDFNDISVNQNVILKYINTYEINIYWSPQIHKNYDFNSKNRICLFIKCLKYKQKITNIKIPKFVLFEIIKLMF